MVLMKVIVMVCYQLVDERDNESYKGNNPMGLCSIRNIMSPLITTPLRVGLRHFTCMYQLSIFKGSKVERSTKVVVEVIFQ